MSSENLFKMDFISVVLFTPIVISSLILLMVSVVSSTSAIFKQDNNLIERFLPLSFITIISQIIIFMTIIFSRDYSSVDTTLFTKEGWIILLIINTLGYLLLRSATITFKSLKLIAGVPLMAILYLCFLSLSNDLVFNIVVNIAFFIIIILIDLIYSDGIEGEKYKIVFFTINTTLPVILCMNIISKLSINFLLLDRTIGFQTGFILTVEFLFIITSLTVSLKSLLKN